jgi:hypothetical protein
MTRLLPRLLALFALTVCLTGSASAGTLTGVVRNGTTGAPAASAIVTLLALQGNMETVADTKTDAQGRYRLENAAIGAQPMLVRVVYRGVMFHASLPPGRDTADVQVFDPTTDPKSIAITSRVMVFQPRDTVLLVGEEYTVRNDTKPPLAFYKNDGNFEFQLPDGAELAQVSAWGPSGMPTVQGTMDRAKNHYAIAFPLRPGESGIRLSYQLPYSGNKAVLKASSPYSAARVILLVPPTMQVTSPGFAPAGSEQGMNIFTHETMPLNTPFEISISGTAPPPSAAGDSGQPDAINGRDTGVPVQTIPARMDSLKWVFVGGFVGLFALGALFLWRRPTAAFESAAPEPAPPPARSSGSRSKPAKGLPDPVPAAPRNAEVGHISAELDRRVSHSLDELKDTLFRLELRRQAGTISDEEYARERSRAEKILRDLVRG